MSNDELWQKMQPFFMKIDTIAENISCLKEKVCNIENKINILNINSAQMLEQQVKFMAEQKIINKITNKKIDMYIMKNEAEHKKFEYDIANLNSLGEMV